MPSDPSIYNLVGQGVTPLMTPAEIQARKNALALQEQEISKNALGLDQMRQQVADQQNLRGAMRQYYADHNTVPAANPQLFDTTPSAPPASPMAPAPGPSSAPDTSGFYVGGSPAPSSMAAPASAAAPGAPAATPAAPAAVPVPQRPPTPTMADLIRMNVAPSDASALIQQFQKIDENAANIDKTQKEAAKAQGELAGLVQEQGANAAHAVIASNYNPSVIAWQLQHFASMGPQFAQMSAHIGAALQANPSAAPQIFQSIADAGNGQRKAGADETTANEKRDRLAAELPGIQADNVSKVLKAEGKEPIQPGQQQQLDKLTDEAELAHKAAAGDPVAKRALELLARTRQASQPVISLTPEAQAMLANNYAQTGNMPSIPRGQGGAIVAGVLNKAAANDPNVNLGANRASYKADSGALVALQKQRDVVGAFEQTASKNLDMFLDLAKKIPDTGVPWLNLPLRMVDQKLAGSANIAAVTAARNVANNEIAKVTSNPGLAGALSDSARHEVAEYNPANATYAQTLAVAKVLRQDMANRPAALDDAIKQVKARLGSNAPSTAPHDVPQPGQTFNGQKVLSVTRVE